MAPVVEVVIKPTGDQADKKDKTVEVGYEVAKGQVLLALGNLTPADVYHGRAREIVTARDLVKEQTMRRRRRNNLGLRPLNEEVIRPEVYRECVH